MKSSLRGFSGFVTGAAVFALALLALNCQPTGGENMGASGGTSGGQGGDGSGGTTSTGGTTNTGGSKDTGGTTSTGGSKDTGGTTSKGGASSGGNTSKGGAGSGGTTSKGGAGSGGTTNTGGTSNSSGGTTSTGGTTTTVPPGSGGVGNTGGTSTTPTGGTTGSDTKNSGSTVTFKSGKAAGAMTGYGWVALGSSDSITDPTCGASKTPITAAAACAADTNWSATDKLCITGGCPALPASPSSTDYANNYGVVVGVNAGDAGGTGDASLVLGQTFTSVTIATSGMPTTEVRAQIHKKGDSDSNSYCLKYTTGAMSFTSFATDCYATAPTGLFKAADVPNIDKISLEAISVSGTAVSVTSMCMTGITFK